MELLHDKTDYPFPPLRRSNSSKFICTYTPGDFPRSSCGPGEYKIGQMTINGRCHTSPTPGRRCDGPTGWRRGGRSCVVAGGEAAGPPVGAARWAGLRARAPHHYLRKNPKHPGLHPTTSPPRPAAPRAGQPVGRWRTPKAPTMGADRALRRSHSWTRPRWAG